MAFESKRLRVQLPCKKGETLVEKEVDAEAVRMECPRFVSATGCPHVFVSATGCHPFVSPHHPVEVMPAPGCTDFRTLDCRLFQSCRHLTVPNCGRTEVGCGVTEVPCWGHATFDCGITDACLRGTQVCGAPTFDPGFEPIVVDPDPENPDTVLLRPEDLGRVRRQLQAELERIESLEERRGEIEGQLKEIESAEKALKKRSKRK